MGVCLGDLPRLGALEDHCLHPSPRALSLHGAQGDGVRDWLDRHRGRRAGVHPYLSSPPARSFCKVELGPHVLPFFLPPTSSSFFGGPLRLHVPPPLLPPQSMGVTGWREVASES